MFQGLRTVIYHVSDMEKAKEWYSALLNKPPYFDEPFYIGFNVGGYELGLQPFEEPYTTVSTGNVVTYWGVPDASVAMANLLEMGATEQEAVQDVGDGIRVGAALDPFGNVVGIIENPHFKIESSTA